MKKHTSSLTIPVNHIGGHSTATSYANGGADTSGGTPRIVVRDQILAEEIDRMNDKMRELNKSFEDLTKTTGVYHGDIKNSIKNYDKGAAAAPSSTYHQQRHEDNITTSSHKNGKIKDSILLGSDRNNGYPPNTRQTDYPDRQYTTIPRNFLSSAPPSSKQQQQLSYDDDPKDSFEREIANFRQNFEEFKRSSTGAPPDTITDLQIPKPFVTSGVPPTYKQQQFDERSPSSFDENPLMINKMNENHAIKENSSGNKVYQITLNMQDFKSQDIKVKIVDGKILRVEAKAETKTDNGGTIQKEFNREFTIPPNVDVEGLVSRIDARGTMTLEAPVFGNGGDPLASRNNNSSSSRSFGATRNEFFTRNESQPSSVFKKIRDEFDDWSPFGFSTGGERHNPGGRKYSWSDNNNNNPLTAVNPHSSSLNHEDDYSSGFGRRSQGNGGSHSLNRKMSGTTSPTRWNEFKSTNGKYPPVSEKILRHSPYYRSNTSAGAGAGEGGSAGGDPFKLTFDLTGFTGDEIRVNVCDNSTLKVTAKHESKSPNESISREFNREYTLPPHVNPDSITSSLSRDGTLTIECSKNGGYLLTGNGSKQDDVLGPPMTHTTSTLPNYPQNASSRSYQFSPSSHRTLSMPQTTPSPGNFNDSFPSTALPSYNNRQPSSTFTTEPRASSSTVLYDNEGLENDKTFKLSFDMNDYDPQDIKIKILGDTLRIEAKHSENSATKGSIIREFSREFIIPRGVEHDKLVSSFSNSGMLTIRAPVHHRP